MMQFLYKEWVLSSWLNAGCSWYSHREKEIESLGKWQMWAWWQRSSSRAFRMHQSWTHSSLESSWWSMSSLWWGTYSSCWWLSWIPTCTHPCTISWATCPSLTCGTPRSVHPKCWWPWCPQKAVLSPSPAVWPSSTPSTSLAAPSASSTPSCPMTASWPSVTRSGTPAWWVGGRVPSWPQPRGLVALCTLLFRPHWRSVCPSADPTRSSITSVMHRPSSNWPVQTRPPWSWWSLSALGWWPQAAFFLLCCPTCPSSVPSWRSAPWKGDGEPSRPVPPTALWSFASLALVFSFTWDQAPRGLWTGLWLFSTLWWRPFWTLWSTPWGTRKWRKLCWSLKTKSCTHKANKLYYVDTHILKA